MRVFLLMFLLGLAGCGGSTTLPPLEIPTHLRAKSLLVSEVQDRDERASLLQCPIIIKNPARQPQKFKLIGTGCTCYGVRHEGRDLSVGDELVVPPGGTVELGIRTVIGAEEAERDYLISLESQVDGVPQQTQVQCRLQVHDDLRMVPGILTVRGTPQTGWQMQRNVIVEHVYRAAAPGDFTVRGDRLPSGVVLENLAPVSTAELLDDGLWRQRWSAQFNLQLVGKPDAVPAARLSLVAAKANEIVAQGHADIVIENTQPITFPSRIPLGKIAVGEKRERRLLISSSGEQQLSLKLAEDDKLPDWLQLEFEPARENRQWVRLSVVAKESREWQQTLIFTTGLPEQPTVSISLEASFISRPQLEN